MIQLPKIKRDPEETEDLCKCRPICKSRRRDWKGEIMKPSAELLLERKPISDCKRRWPKKVYPNSPCPLWKRTRAVTVVEKYTDRQPKVVRICQAPVDDTAPTPYLNAAALVEEIGALALVPFCCPFCMCGKCCPCGERDYPLHDPDRNRTRKEDRRKFDTRVKTENLIFRNMYEGFFD